MIHNKKFIKFITTMMCFVIFFSFGSVSNANVITKVYNKVVESISATLVAFGDGVLHIVAAGAGEIVTIDRLVFNDVGKVSIDYWNDIDDSPAGGGNKAPIKNYMVVPIRKWYPVFNKIAIMVYMVVLVFIGVRVMLSSTGEKKAKYKDLTTSWIVGLAILFLFPFAMKYIIMINDALADTLQAKAKEVGGYVSNGEAGAELASMSFWDAWNEYGKKEFSERLGGNGDIMVMTRSAVFGDEDEPQGLVLALVYLILIGQTIAVLIMYYQRAFMIAFLITIFPLVAMSYVLDKVGDGKAQSFGIWFKEFMVNVIVQTFHAVVYVLITGGVVSNYIKYNGSNFIFLILCVLFLFEGEKILRGIFGITSKAKTIGDLATSGAMMIGMLSNAGGLFKRDKSEMGSAQDKKENSAATSRIKSKTKMQQDNEAAAAKAMEDKKSSGGSLESRGEYQGNNNEPYGVRSPKYDGENARDKLLTKAMKRRLVGGLATKATRFTAGAAGAALVSARNMADGGYDKPGEIIGGIIAGKDLGKTLATPVAKGINAIERRHSGNVLAKQIRKGDMNKDLGINNLPLAMPISTGEGDVDLSQVKQQEVNAQEIYKEALARYAKVASRAGQAKAEIAYYKYLEKNLKK